MAQFKCGEIITFNGKKWKVTDETPFGSTIAYRYYWFDAIVDWMRRKLGI